jgi:hypothetical protein
MVSTPSRARRGPAGVVSLLAGLMLWTAPPAPAAPSFEARGVDLERKRAYDVGVVDFNRDGRLDLYSTNHMFRDSLLDGDGAGRFEDAYRSAGFAPNPAIPGIEDLSRSPEVDDPGLYMWVRAGDRRPHIRLATKALKRIGDLDETTVSGRIVVAFPKVKVRRLNGAEVDVVRKSRTRTVIRFELGPNARLVLRPNHIDLPFRTRIDAPLPLENVFLGPRSVAPPAREFSISLGDRHGVAWADYDRDGLLDAFISSGGLSGKSRLVPRLGRDELLLNRDRVLVDATSESGLRKGDCRGREAQSLDFDRDRRLDIFLGCRAGRPRLYRGVGDGTFTEQRRALRGIGNAATANRWVDLDNDGVLELVRAGQFSVAVWSLRRDGRARLEQRIDTPNDDKNVEALAPGDFDNDGDLDLFLAAPSGNSLLVNRGTGRLAARDPRRYGLPARHGAAAAWVDYDNDTRLDLYVSPDGLFRNVGRGFRKVGALGTAGSARFARATWFDADRDGRRDLVRLTQRGRGNFPQIRMFENETARRNHWLALDLIGPRGNLQAVGARVEARVGTRTLTQWVGQNDGSRYGQGHYRLYFGLGRTRRAERVTVFWPDGGRSRLGAVGADRLRVVRR